MKRSASSLCDPLDDSIPSRPGRGAWDIGQSSRFLSPRSFPVFSPDIWPVIAKYLAPDADGFYRQKASDAHVDFLRKSMPEGAFDCLMSFPSVCVAGGAAIPDVVHKGCGDIDFFFACSKSWCAATIALGKYDFVTENDLIEYWNVRVFLEKHKDCEDVVRSLFGFTAHYSSEIKTNVINFVPKSVLRGYKKLQLVNWNQGRTISHFDLDYHQCQIKKAADGTYILARTPLCVEAHNSKTVSYINNARSYDVDQLRSLLLKAHSKGYNLPPTITDISQLPLCILSDDPFRVQLSISKFLCSKMSDRPLNAYSLSTDDISGFFGGSGRLKDEFMLSLPVKRAPINPIAPRLRWPTSDIIHMSVLVHGKWLLGGIRKYDVDGRRFLLLLKESEEIYDKREDSCTRGNERLRLAIADESDDE